jgi:hypothetical protein
VHFFVVGGAGAFATDLAVFERHAAKHEYLGTASQGSCDCDFVGAENMEGPK